MEVEGGLEWVMHGASMLRYRTLARFLDRRQERVIRGENHIRSISTRRRTRKKMMGLQEPLMARALKSDLSKWSRKQKSTAHHGNSSVLRNIHQICLQVSRSGSYRTRIHPQRLISVSIKKAYPKLLVLSLLTSHAATATKHD